MAQPHVPLGAVSAPSGWCCCATGCPMCALSCLVSVFPARSINQASLCPEMWGHIYPHVCLHNSSLPGPSTPKPRHPFPCRPRGRCRPVPVPAFGLCPIRLSAARPCRCSSAAPGRTLHPHVRLLFVSFSLRVGLYPVPPAPPRPRPPAQPPPEPATHTSELFCVFQQLKRIKQQLSPGRAWILVTLIFCVAGQGEWGY